jgi:hypothetical protein
MGRIGVIGFSSNRYRSRSSNNIATKKTLVMFCIVTQMATDGDCRMTLG